MTLKKITDRDLQGYGVIGMADTPNLSARQMQEKVEEVVRSVVIPIMNENVDNTVSKEDLADAVLNAGAGDMMTVRYDSNQDGIVNNADNGFFTYTHSKEGNIHYLDGSGDNIKFISVADYNEGDVFMLGGNYCPAFLTNGEQLPDGYFKTDFVVSCFRYGNCLNFSNGGAELNFKIVGGTTAPASPRENMIWINTDVAIGEYQFSAAEPVARADGTDLQTGDVWIKTGRQGKTLVNILKKNSVNIYLASAYQWDGTAWLFRQAMIYQDSRWESFTVYLYSRGEEYTDITGGWRGTESSSYYNTGKITKNADNITLASSTMQAIYALPENTIDITDATAIAVNITAVTNSCSIGVIPSGGSISAGSAQATVSITAAGLYYTDVSALTGRYYPTVAAFSDQRATGCVFDEVYLIY